ncbi:MAG: SDR family NAD(P)-dependent oxidoreductase [Bdellovibrionaceae bacterium]|nr:SDR family NAD(P)-dependent oxidoreductase [Bdellovibrio sp.]
MKKKSKCYTLITGASAGIGRATALMAAAKNHNLILTARRLDRLQALQLECLKAGATDVQIFEVDVRNRASVEALAQQMKAQNIKLKNLINNAGLAKGTELFQNADLNNFNEMIDTNVKGLLNVTRIMLPFLIETRGHIINLGSVAGRLVYEGGSVYCASKFAVRALTEGLRMDLKGTGIRVTNIAPGMVNTDFSLVRLGNQQKADSVYSDMMPLSANDIAETILWCVERPAHVNIQELVIYPTDQATVGQVVRGEKSIKNLTEFDKSFEE